MKYIFNFGAWISQIIPSFFLILICSFSSSAYAAELEFSFAATGNEYVTISSDRDIDFNSFKVGKPYRLVIDIKNISSQTTEYLNKNEHIAKLSVSGTGSGTRIVIEPTNNVPLVLKQVSKNTLAVIGVPESVQKPAPVLHSTPGVSATVTATTASVSATSLIIKDNSIIIGTSGFVDNVSTFTFPESDRLVFVLKDTALTFKEGRYPLGFLNMSHLEVEKEGPNTKLTFTVKTKKAIPNYLSTKDTNAVTIRFFVIEEPSSAQHAEAPATPKKITQSSDPNFKSPAAKFKGQKISLDFDNAELKQIFRLLSEVNKKNYILSDEVKGTLSIKLMNVPWDQAYDLILRVNNLASVEEGNIVEIISYNQKVERIKKQLEIDELSKPQENVGICAVQLRHAGSVKVATIANTILTRGASERSQDSASKSRAKTLADANIGADPTKTEYKGSSETNRNREETSTLYTINNIYAEPNTNRLIIRDLPSKFPEILRVLSLLDVPDQQVMIEARIVQASSDFTKSLGVQWGVHYRDGSASFMGINSLDTGFGGVIDRIAPTTGLPDSSLAGIGTGISFGTLSSNINLDLRLSAAADMSMAKVISTPRIATTYGETANIKDGTQYPYAKTDGLSGQVTYEFKDAVLSLDVTPTITPACDVIMKVEVTNDSLGSAINGQVPINKKSAKTTLSVKNGETAVIGGTYIKDDTEGEAGVPYLMDIPLLGKLFKSKQSSEKSRELLIFLTPRLLNSNCIDSDVMKLKYNKLECSNL